MRLLCLIVAAQLGTPLQAADRLAPGNSPLLTLEIKSAAPPPTWALWQRQLLEQLWPAAREFVRSYTRPDGTLIWREAWPGMDGSWVSRFAGPA